MELGLTTLTAIGAVSFVLGVGLAYLYHSRVAARLDEEVNELERQALEAVDHENGEAGYAIEMDPPDVGRSVFDVLKVWWHIRKGARLAKRGYVKWYRVGSRIHTPKWIKPKHKGAGEYEYKSSRDDVTYVFPEEALVTDGQTGAYVAFHKIGEAEPIPFRDPGWPAMEGDLLQKVIDMASARKPPSALSSLPFSRGQMKYLGFGVLFIAVYIGTQYYMGGA